MASLPLLDFSYTLKNLNSYNTKNIMHLSIDHAYYIVHSFQKKV